MFNFHTSTVHGHASASMMIHNDGTDIYFGVIFRPEHVFSCIVVLTEKQELESLQSKYEPMHSQ